MQGDSQCLLTGMKNRSCRGWGTRPVKAEGSRKSCKASESGGDAHRVALGTGGCLWALPQLPSHPVN